MSRYRINLALVAVAALMTTHRTALAQENGSFGHFGDFNSAQGAAGQYSTTAPGMYASGQYRTAGPFRPRPAIVTFSYVQEMYLPYPRPARSYTAGTTSQAVQSNPYLPYSSGSLPASAAPRTAAPAGPDLSRWISNEQAQGYYDRGFREGYDEGLRRGIPPHTRAVPWDRFGSY